MAIGGVVINFVAKTRDAITDVDKLTRAVGDVGDKAKSTSGKMGKLSGAMKAGLAAGAVAAGTALISLADFMLEAGQAAVEDQKSVEKLAGILAGIPGVTEDAITANEDWITSMQLATQVADTDLRDAVGKLSLATGDLDEAQRLAAAAADLSTISGKNYSTVADAMTKAATGNETALKRIAPWLDVNRDGSVDLAEALGLLEGKYSDAAEAAAEQDPWETLKIIWDELKESLGKWLLPLIEKFGKWFRDPANQKNIQNIIDKVGDLAEKMGKDLVPALEDFLGWVTSDKGKEDMKRWAGYIESTATAVSKLFGWMDKLSKLNPLVLIDKIASSLSKLPSWIGGAGPNLGAGGGPSGGSWSATPAARTGTSIGTLVYYGSGDLTRDAKKLKRLLEAEDVEQGRTPGQRLAVAW